MPTTQPLKVHITGVYGLIGNLMYRHLSSQPDLYDVYGSGRRTVGSMRAGQANIVPLPADHFKIADLSDAQAVKNAIVGIDAVLHIGAAPGPDASFDVVLDSNIRGTYNVLEACREAGVRRLVYASSIMISNGHFRYTEPYKAIREGRWADIPETIPVITHKDPPRPTEPYSASKVYCEGLCRTYTDAHAISTICLRLGYVNQEDHCETPFANSEWLSHRDCVNLIELALVATEKPVFEICYGVSGNQHRWVDIEHTQKVLDYIPQDSHERRAAEISENESR
jgi:NAD+ dependent glucose-6-phosphate dehydrogenase